MELQAQYHLCGLLALGQEEPLYINVLMFVLIGKSVKSIWELTKYLFLNKLSLLQCSNMSFSREI